METHWLNHDTAFLILDESHFFFGVLMSVILLDDVCGAVGKVFFVLFFLNYTIAQSST